MQNPCIRCGRERIDGRVWTEMAGLVTVTHVQTVCPDTNCQKIVDEEIAERRQKKELIMNARKNRARKFQNKSSA